MNHQVQYTLITIWIINTIEQITHINIHIYIYIRIYKSNKCPVTSCFAWALYYLWFDILDIQGMITVHETGSPVPKQPVWRDVRGFWTLLIWWGHYIPQFQLHTIAIVGISYITIWLGHDILYPINGHTIPGGIYIYMYWWYKLHWDDHQSGSLQRRAYWWLHIIYWWCYIVILFYYTCTYCLYYMTFQ